MCKKKNDIQEKAKLENYLNNLVLADEEKHYIENRILSQIDWYDKKSIVLQKKFKIYSIIIIFLNGLIPFWSIYSDFNYGIVFKSIIVLSSSLAAIIGSFLALNQYKELWVQYRSNCEILKSVLYRYITKTGEFCNIDNSFSQLVMVCEEYFTKEFQTWVAGYTPGENCQDSSTNS